MLHFCRFRPWRGIVGGMACCLILAISWIGAERAYAAGWSIQRLRPAGNLARAAHGCFVFVEDLVYGGWSRWYASAGGALGWVVVARAEHPSAGRFVVPGRGVLHLGGRLCSGWVCRRTLARVSGAGGAMERLDLEASVDSAVGALPRCDAHWGFLHVGECVCRGRLGTCGPRTRSLVERWNGSRWEIQPTPQPTHSSGSSLQAVACVSARSCTAVGGTIDRELADSDIGGHAMALRWNGKSWKLQRPRSDPTLDATTLNGVSCPSANRCVAVGSADMTGYAGDAPPEHVVIERWDGSRWASQRAKLVAGMSGEHGLDAVSCTSPLACTAVGSAWLGASPLVERFDGTRWTRQSRGGGLDDRR